MAPGVNQAVFWGLGGLGFWTLWGIMTVNGGTRSMLETAWTGVLPDGSDLKTGYIVVPPFNFLLSSVLAFYSAVVKLRDVDAGPYLIILELATFLLVFNTMVLVESRRSYGFWLRHPAIWQCLCNAGGTAVVFPIWTILYMKQQTNIAHRILPGSESYIFPFTAAINILFVFSVIIPAWIGLSPAAIQDGIVFFFASAAISGTFQVIASRTISKKPDTDSIRCVKAAYLITGTASALGHIVCVAWAITSSDPNLSLSRIYLPHGDYVQPGQANILTEAAHLFLQYDYIITAIATLAFGYHILHPPLANKRNLEASRDSTRMLLVMTIGFGPGAGLAYAASRAEEFVQPGAPRAMAKR